MTPTHTMNDMSNSRRRQSVFPCDLGELFTRRGTIANATNIILSQLRTRMVLANARRCATFGIHIGHVIGLRSDEEMGGIEAAGIVAVVKDVEFAFDVESEPEHRGDPMDGVRSAIEQNSSITSAVLYVRASPVPAIRHRIDSASREQTFLNARHRFVSPTFARAIKRRSLPCMSGRHGEYVSAGRTDGRDARAGGRACRLREHRSLSLRCRAGAVASGAQHHYFNTSIIHQTRMQTRKMSANEPQDAPCTAGS